MPDQIDKSEQSSGASPAICDGKQVSGLAQLAAIAAIVVPTFILSGAILETNGIEIGFFLLKAGFISLFALPLLSILAVIHVSWKNTHKGILRALAAIVVFILCFVVFPATDTCRMYMPRLKCRNNLRELQIAISLYSKENNGKLPLASCWCDSLIEDSNANPKSFVCWSSVNKRGESSYVFNHNISGAKLKDLPDNIVLLFEPNSWLRPNNYVPDSNHAADDPTKFKVIADYTCSWFVDVNGIHKLLWNKKCDSREWNQNGGREIISPNHHGGDGCNVLFVSGKAKFIIPEDFPSLRWKP